MTADARPVAVLGAGIMGSSTALHLARAGVPVTLFDRAAVPFAGASRWNEGKIHLGHLYAADPSLDTARAVLPGGLAFRDEVEALTGVGLADLTTPDDDLYLVHRDSVVSADDAARYFAAVTALAADHPLAGRYLVDLSAARSSALSPDELAAVADPAAVVAGHRVPERSVDTNAVADAFVAALAGEARIDLALGRTVTAVRAGDGGPAWTVVCDDGAHGPFAAVVNALWEGRPAVDRSVGHAPDVAPQHRYRVSLFVRTAHAVRAPSAVVAAGPFGDVKAYALDRFYVSWYDAGLLARAESTDPPPPPELDDRTRSRIVEEVFASLGAVLPWVGDIAAAVADVRVEGGWVYAQGRGTLDDARATVHRRDRLGITNVGTYFSVDTGKYSVAPSLARVVASAILEGAGR